MARTRPPGWCKLTFVTAMCYLMTHPEVVVDASTPVDQWSLSPAGRARAGRLGRLPWTAHLDRVISSAERKAVETAEILGTALRLTPEVDPALGENDRRASGFLPPEEFERVADAFFGSPSTSVRGWETAVAAQRRVVEAVQRHTADRPESIAFVAHGAVGTLLWCDLQGVPIDRAHDQPGQGSWYAFDPEQWTALHPWVRID